MIVIKNSFSLELLSLLSAGKVEEKVQRIEKDFIFYALLAIIGIAQR
ncbi:hypothetical protein KCN56_01585 [Photobacterium galatheae]|nr:hypothetical protein [Photobacterium galatheae]MCM0147261.1 hypothetical protein [Photobacterium galatheae]